MFKKVKRLILVVFICLSIPFIYDRNIEKYFTQYFPHVLSFNNIKNGAPEFIVMGSSRTLSGFHPDGFKNKKLQLIAIPNMDIQMIDLLLKKHFDILTKANLLIIELDSEMLYLNSLSTATTTRFYLSQLGLSFYQLNPGWSNLNSWTIPNVFPVLTQYRLSPRELWSRITNPRKLSAEKKRLLNLGFEGKKKIFKRSEFLKQNTSRTDFFKKRYSLKGESRGLAVLNGLITDLKSKKINFCFYQPPLSLPYQRHRQKLSDVGGDQFVSIKEDLNCIKKKKSYKNLIFFDPDHLTGASALIFSKDFYRELTKNYDN